MKLMGAMQTGLTMVALMVAGTAMAGKPAPNSNNGKGNDDKVVICHATHSESNPWVIIAINGKAPEKHIELHLGLHEGDKILPPSGDCEFNPQD